MEIHKYLKIKMILFIKLFIKINYKNFNIFEKNIYNYINIYQTLLRLVEKALLRLD